MLLLGLFLLWNWRLASVTALNYLFIDRTELIGVFVWNTAFFAAFVIGLYALFRNMKQTLLGVCFIVIFWLIGGNLISALLSGQLLPAILQFTLIGVLVLISGNAISKSPEFSSRVIAVFGAAVVGIQAPGIYTVLSTQKIERGLTRFESDLPSSFGESLPH
ncbi:MAG: hypothetical protein AAFR82_12385, partial [Pseudomonadota bacterium]